MCFLNETKLKYILNSAKISFVTMTMQLERLYKIKRLSTPSSASQNFIENAKRYYTTWCWYEKRGDKEWKLQVCLFISLLHRIQGVKY